MNRFQTLAAACLIGLPVPLAAQEPGNCWQSAVSTILANDTETHTEYATCLATCLAACRADPDCAGWTFRPHSFDAASPGHCQLLGDIYQTEASDRAVCGRIDR